MLLSLASSEGASRTEEEERAARAQALSIFHRLNDNVAKAFEKKEPDITLPGPPSKDGHPERAHRRRTDPSSASRGE